MSRLGAEFGQKRMERRSRNQKSGTVFSGLKGQFFIQEEVLMIVKGLGES
jgi:hypothetical protein